MNGNIYKDISERTGGDIYVGVVGPVRTGKSTFIKRFMDLMVIPNIENVSMRNRIMDQLPQSGDGRTITTTEPKFVPEEATAIRLKNGISMSVRMVDCVGYMIPGVYGNMEEGKQRMVKTPWNEEEIPFDQAATIGTEKVITDHSTVGIVVTSDGTAGDIRRNDFLDAEKKTIEQMKSLGKPFVVLVNSLSPSGEAAVRAKQSIQQDYDVSAMCCDCQRMTMGEIETIFEKLLKEFFVSEIFIDLPGYMEAVPEEHPIKSEIISCVYRWMEHIDTVGSVLASIGELACCNSVKTANMNLCDMSCGKMYISLELTDGLYYKIIEDLMGHQVKNDRELFTLLKEYAQAKKAFDQISHALFDANEKGYGLVEPDLSHMQLGQPEVFKHGNKYGVRLVATAPCMHLIKTSISTEVSPVVGTLRQSEDLVSYLKKQFQQDETTIWDTNLFGKTLEELVTEQMSGKLSSMPEVLQTKIRKSLQRISNEGKDYFICIIL